ncbi:ENHANCER OF AG-4 protein 2 [Ancistrocladus abbreviatus]
MAPGRKKGANKAKTTKELSLGDLVLAKVKGFPAWPAKVSRPEDWERTSDPKKYFVQFFGTQEMLQIELDDPVCGLFWTGSQCWLIQFGEGVGTLCFCLLLPFV